MTVEEFIELLADCPLESTVMLNDDQTVFSDIEYGRDFVGQRDIIILIGE